MGALPVPCEAMDVALGLTVPAIWPAVATPWRATPRAMGAIVGSSAPIRQARRRTGQQEGAGGSWGGNTGGGGHRGGSGEVTSCQRVERKAYFFTY